MVVVGTAKTTRVCRQQHGSSRSEAPSRGEKILEESEPYRNPIKKRLSKSGINTCL